MSLRGLNQLARCWVAIRAIINCEEQAECSGSINPDTHLGGNLTTLNEVFHGKTTTFVFNRV